MVNYHYHHMMFYYDYYDIVVVHVSNVLTDCLLVLSVLLLTSVLLNEILSVKNTIVNSVNYDSEQSSCVLCC